MFDKQLKTAVNNQMTQNSYNINNLVINYERHSASVLYINTTNMCAVRLVIVFINYYYII